MNAPQRIGPAAKGQVVLVLQGGGALGAYQAGVYQALHEAGIEPDWVIGTSIGAINGALIAGNTAEQRLDRLREFWKRVEHDSPYATAAILAYGIRPFFVPRLPAFGVVHAPVGLDRASYYSTAPLRETLAELVSLECLNAKRMRLTVGAVNVRTGAMRYFDSRERALGILHYDVVALPDDLHDRVPVAFRDDEVHVAELGGSTCPTRSPRWSWS